MARFDRYRHSGGYEAVDFFERTGSHPAGIDSRGRFVTLHRPRWSADDLGSDFYEAISTVRQQLNHLDGFGAEAIAGPLIKTLADVELVAQEALQRARHLDRAYDMVESHRQELADAAEHAAELREAARAAGAELVKERHTRRVMLGRIKRFLENEHRLNRVSRTLAERVEREVADLIPED